jgi:hypothetical protein
MKTNTGKKLKAWLETLDVNKSDIVREGLMSHYSLYTLFEKKEVDWKYI